MFGTKNHNSRAHFLYHILLSQNANLADYTQKNKHTIDKMTSYKSKLIGHKDPYKDIMEHHGEKYRWTPEFQAEIKKMKAPKLPKKISGMRVTEEKDRYFLIKSFSEVLKPSRNIIQSQHVDFVEATTFAVNKYLKNTESE